MQQSSNLYVWYCASLPLFFSLSLILFFSSHSLSLPRILVHPHTNFISSTHYNTINIDEPRIKITNIAMQSRKISGRKQHLRFMPWALCACNFWYTNFRQTNRCERKYDRKNKCKIAKSSIWVFFFILLLLSLYWERTSVRWAAQLCQNLCVLCNFIEKY